MADDPVAGLLAAARAAIARREDAPAQQLYLEILRRDADHYAALIELGEQALSLGHRDAARSLFTRAAERHPAERTGCLTLGNMAFEEARFAEAEAHYRTALARDAGCAAAHRGLARWLSQAGREAEAQPHWRAGFAQGAATPRRYRGAGRAVELLYLAAARGGNVRLAPWIDDRVFAVTTLYADFWQPGQSVPAHDLLVNAAGDADACAPALRKAAQIAAASTAPVINPPDLVLRTGRAALGELCAGIAGLAAPAIRRVSRSELLDMSALAAPMLLRVPGRHTGEDFERVETSLDLRAALARLAGEAFFCIQPFETRGADGAYRKYRVMFIDGAICPWHLAISQHWKVHYVTGAMADHAEFRAEEAAFLRDMPGVLGAPALAALARLQAALGLDYAGADFALDAAGKVLLFEANATMTLASPGPEPIWDYRRPAVEAAQVALRRMLHRRAGRSK
ncbi:MAG: hypothetical protein B7Z80_09745 [Rhodospirillales bacterium 20-64-7]|nr:MAG: hypothetical protein B7Z80_09745 [Rhodospirillales bacterium 20-64-7]